jgi:hypothetical protein
VKGEKKKKKPPRNPKKSEGGCVLDKLFSKKKFVYQFADEFNYY